MTNKFKPLLAIEPEEKHPIKFPCYATPKLDGIRCLMIDGAKTRKLKDVPNDYVRERLSDLPDGLDGELMIDGDFNQVQSAIMKKDGTPNFYYLVFDDFSKEGGYLERIQGLKLFATRHPDVRVIDPIVINNQEELDDYLKDCLIRGYEGVMTRTPDGSYKYGRSTASEQILLKHKVWITDEAILVDIVEKMHNMNEAIEDALGHTKRSTSKENLVPANTAGALVVEWHGKRFNVGFGKGITDEIKLSWWQQKNELIGKFLSFKYQELSKDGVPRFGKALGFRHEDDMSE